MSSGVAPVGSGAEAQTKASRARRRGRGRAWSGIGFAVLFFAGLLPLGDLLGSFGDSDATFVAYFAKDSNEVGALVGGVGLALAGLAFL